jgi:NAD(P)-dependent dehydrogenase (short-subunit alcohol dehydrogenase family)
MGKLNGKIAVVTGGNSGIGLATVKHFVEEGAYVFITGRRQSELDAAVKKIGKNVTAVQGDVANSADLDRLYATVRQEKGHLDVLFANAGTGQFSPLEAITEEHFDKIFDVNVKGLLFTVQKALTLFTDKGGSIILNASIVATKGVPALSVYSASKAAVRSFARSWTKEPQDSSQCDQPRSDRYARRRKCIRFYWGAACKLLPARCKPGSSRPGRHCG